MLIVSNTILSLPAHMARRIKDNHTINLSHRGLRRIVEEQLPAWKRACAASDTHAIVLHEAAFGTSQRELFLFACAIKYAALEGKNVHIACGGSDRARMPEVITPSHTLARTYRDRGAGKVKSRAARQRARPKEKTRRRAAA
jgi:hypothetical protein